MRILLVAIAPVLMWLWASELISPALLATGSAVSVTAAGIWTLYRRPHHVKEYVRDIARVWQDRDAVTGMLNHPAVYEWLQRLLRQALQHKHTLAVVRLDIDRFGLYNLTHGHGAGDRLLRCVSDVLRKNLPPTAVVGRYDADEFLIVLPSTAREQALDIAHKLDEQLRQIVVAQATNGQSIPITASFGIACFPADADTVQGLLSASEEALATARMNGSGVADISSSWRARYRIHENGSFSTLEAMIVAIDNKDHYTRKHSEEVTDYALWIAEEMGLHERDQHRLRLAGLVHDVGKIGIPDEVLLKPDVLTPAEYEVMKQHAVMGALMLAALPNMSDLAPIVRAHHERWDGAGYPDGLKGEEIPLLARILAVADAFSAMTTDRPYRRGMDWQSAIAELRSQRGKQFDPAVIDVFVHTLRRRLGNKDADEAVLPKAA